MTLMCEGMGKGFNTIVGSSDARLQPLVYEDNQASPPYSLFFPPAIFIRPAENSYVSPKSQTSGLPPTCVSGQLSYGHPLSGIRWASMPDCSPPPHFRHDHLYISSAIPFFSGLCFKGDSLA